MEALPFEGRATAPLRPGVHERTWRAARMCPRDHMMKLRFAAFVIAAAAVGCGGGGTSKGKTAFDAKGRPLPVARDAEGRGVSLTGEHAYDDRHDSSGWSGKTALPGAVAGGGGVGGGPKPESSASPAVIAPAPAPAAAPPKPATTAPAPPAGAPPPAASPSAPPAPSASAKPPPSKELDTAPPPKELQF